MIACQQPDCQWQGFTSDLSEHEFVDHGIGTWGDAPDCRDCGGNGEVVTRLRDWNGEEKWDPCRTCRGRGFVA